jgi:Rrf2 family protein
MRLIGNGAAPVLRVSAKVDYAVRALVRIAEGGGAPVKMHTIADREEIPAKFLSGTLTDLRRAQLIESRRGGGGGYWLARPPADITVADIIRVIDGELVDVRALSSEKSVTTPVWASVRLVLECTLDAVTLADLTAPTASHESHRPGS